MLEGSFVNICCILRQRIFGDDSGWSCSAAPSSSHTSDKCSVETAAALISSKGRQRAFIYPEYSWMFEMQPLWGWCVVGGRKVLHSCEIRAQRNFKETTSHVRSKTADCHCICDDEEHGYKTAVFFLTLSSVLTVQHEYGEPVQIRAADAFQHPGGRTGGPGPGHRCPQGTQNSSNKCSLLKYCPVVIALCQAKSMEKNSATQHHHLPVVSFGGY